MKLTFVTTSLNSGGAERVMSILANGFAERGHEVEVVLLTKPAVFYDIRPEVKLHLLTQHLGHNFAKKLLWLRRHVRKERPDAVIPFMTDVFCATLFALIGTGVPVVTSERIDPAHSKLHRKILRGLLLPLTTHHVVQTEAIKRYYSKRIQRKTTIIYNPVNEAALASYDLPKEDLVVSVGRLFPQKNFPMLIAAFGRVAKEFPTYRLAIFGEGYLRESLERQVADEGLEDRVLLPGRCANIFPELAKARLFAMTSDYEGMSNAMIEAICMGLPVLTTRVSGTDELVQEGVNGYVVPRGDLEAYTAKLRQLLSDSSAMSRMGDQSRQQASRFSTAAVVGQWETLIKEVAQ